MVRGPHSIVYGTNLRLTAMFGQQPQYGIDGSGVAYENMDTVYSGNMSLSWLIVPLEQLRSFGYVDPSDIAGIGDQLLKKLYGDDGVNFMCEDKLSGKMLFRASAAKMTALSVSITRRAVLFREAAFIIRTVPSFINDDFFTGHVV
jgi:hypothetical protein